MPTKSDKDLSPFQNEHFGRDELAARWKVESIWVSRNYGRLGLRPVRISAKLLFRRCDVEEVERRAMLGEIEAASERKAPQAEANAQPPPALPPRREAAKREAAKIGAVESGGREAAEATPPPAE